MNDRRVAVIREALESLVDSLSATSRLKRWDENDAVPESLQKSAALLAKRLESANTLARASFVGSPLVVSRLNGISDAIRRLDRAWSEYESRVARAPEELSRALDVLDTEVDEVKFDSDRWS